MAILGRELTEWGRRMQGEYEKNYDFRPISRFISQTMQDKAIVTKEGE